MRTPVKNKDVMAGLLFGALGLTGIGLSLGYSVGSAGRMGPGYVPLMISFGLTAMASLIVAVALFHQEPDSAEADAAEGWKPRPLVVVMAGILLFALSITSAGLIVAGGLLLLCCAFATTGSRFREHGLAAVILICAVALVFIYGVGVRIELLPNFVQSP